MSKKIIALILVVAVIITVIIVKDPFSRSREAEAAVFRNGFLLTPTKQDITGIAADTHFILELESTQQIDPEVVMSSIFIEGEETPSVLLLSDGSYEIVPAKALAGGRVYIVGITEGNGNTTTWAWQTSSGLKIISNFPGDKSTSVPVETGIEIYFNQSGFSGYEDKIEIVPAVTGVFEVHKNVLVFVSDKLDHNTVYTVTVKEGITLKDTEIKTTGDHTFSFATAPKEETASSDKGYFMFGRELTEFSSTENILVPLYYYSNRNEKEGTFLLETKIYAFRSVEDFKKAYEDNSLVPYWARGQLKTENTDTSALSLVLTKTFELPSNQSGESDRYLDFGPGLPRGYYIIEAEYGENIYQTFVQVTDMAVFVMNTDTRYFLWIKDLNTKENISGAVLEFDDKKVYTSDENGAIIADFDTMSDSNMAVIKNGNDALIVNLYDYDPGSYRYYSGRNLYWNIFQTDRSLYKPDDAVNFFGFIKPRYSDDPSLNKVTVEISRGGFYPYYMDYYEKEGIRGFYYPGMYEPLIRQDISVVESFFEGSIQLPSLSEGNYNIIVKDGDEILSSSYISVENFVKPSYRMEMTKSKRAIFLGDPVEIIVRSSFFEGTPVANLDFRIDIGTSFGGEYTNNQERTDTEGIFTLEYKPVSATSDAQGMQHAWINMTSSIPEMGEIYVNDQLYVFINDIWPLAETYIEDGRGVFEIDVRYIDLDEINNNEKADVWSSFTDGPVANRIVNGKISRIEYVRKKTGDYYDFINKVKRDTYTFERVVTLVDSFDIITGVDGKARYEFIPEETDRNIYYTVEYTLKDSNGRQIKNTSYFYNKGSNNVYYEYEYDEYSRLEIQGNEGFNVGDEVRVKYLHLGKVIEDGNYAFIQLQNGLRDIDFTDSPVYAFDFMESMMPNTIIGAVYFTGKYFEYLEGHVPYDHSERKISLKASLDKESYRPGENAVINIWATDEKGLPVSAAVNIAVVDEALFAMGEQYIDTLESLFSYVGSGVKYTNSTHTLEQGFYGPVFSGRGATTVDSALMKNEESMDMAQTVPSQGETAAYVRSDFKDTAYFKTVYLDEDGKGSLTMDLPDNITSWRVTMQAVSSDISAGSDKVSLDVSMPMFINYSLSDVFLTGDMPYIGVSVYGTSLNEDDNVRIIIEGEGIYLERNIKAFERYYLPLARFNESGIFEMKITATGPGSETDAIIHRYTVMGSYHETDIVKTLKAEAGMTLPAGEAGLTTYMFADASTGRYAPVLYSLLYQGINRIEHRAVSKAASELVRKYFNDDHGINNFDAKQYQKSDGGIAFLPYGESDIFTTVMVLPYIMDEVDISILKMYLYTVLETADMPNARSAAIYGLSILGEPVLIDLREYEKIENLDITDRIYIALAYAAFREIPEARRVYSLYIQENIVETDQNARLEFGQNIDEKLKNTALTAMLAVKISVPEQEALFNYITKEYSNEYLTIIEKLEYVRTMLDRSAPVLGEVKYEYLGENKVIDISTYQRSITIPSKFADQLRILEVKGDVVVYAVYKGRMTLAPSGSSISVSREYTNYTRPGQPLTKNDIIKVTLKVYIGKDVLDRGFEVTDYLPSGLRPVGNNRGYYNKYDDDMMYYISSEGQKVFVSVYGDRNNDVTRTISYLARVVNPGTFKAESTVMRGYADKGLIAVGNPSQIAIAE